MARLLTLEQINSALGFTLSADFIEGPLNVSQCQPGRWDAADFQALRHRLVNYTLYRVELPAEEVDVDSFFDDVEGFFDD